jgi:hypothetical protein
MIARSIFYILFLLAPWVSAQPVWELKKEKNGISVYSLKTDTGAFNAIKVEARLRGKVEDMVAILLDVEHHHQWAYGTKSAAVLKRLSPHEIIFYKEIKSPGPVSDRDMVVRMNVIHHSATKVTKVESVALPDFIPPKKDFVRIPKSKEIWEIAAVADRKIKINYYLQVDPGGSLPPFLVNLFVSKGPYETFENLRNLLEERLD